MTNPLRIDRRKSPGSSAVFTLLGMVLCLSGLPSLSLLSAGSVSDREVAEVKVAPSNIRLHTKTDQQSIMVQAVYADGTTRDVTEEASYALAETGVVRLEKQVVYPVADGQTHLQIQVEGQSLQVPVEVKDATADRLISFNMDVMPVFMKAGCNAGSCHGASRGKDKFRLSLFGFDSKRDYHSLTREFPGRRVNVALPGDSLLLEKAAGRVTHTGGKLMEEDSELYGILLRWLQAGAPKDADDVAKVVDLEIEPKQAVLEGAGTTQRLNARAIYSDGTDRDVTDMVVYGSNNDVTAKVSVDGHLTAGEPGEAFILARYADLTVGSQVLVIPKDPDFVFPDLPENNYIDTLVHQKLKKIRIKPSEICDDQTFLRRITLDIIGRLPSSDEVKIFTQDEDSRKRSRKIDELLERNEFVRMWVMKWAELLQIRTQNNQFSYKNAVLYFEWLRDQFAENRPLNEMVQELLAAKGGTFSNPAGNFFQVERDTLKLTENAAQVFMGMRIQCAQCHNHPFDRWTMDDYYSFASFFSQVGRKTGEDNRETIIFNRGSGAVRHPVGNRDMPPKFLGGDQPDVKGKDRRAVLAKWLASSENPFFAKNMANMVWAHFLGKGIVDPVDDVRISNPPSNPELLEELGRRFQESNYDFKSLVRDICNSRAYQHSVHPNETNRDDERNFSKAYVRRIRAEVLLDIISQVTETKNKFTGLPLGASASEIVDGRTSTYFLTTFGRATRDTVCSCEVKLEPNLSQALHLLNGNTVNQKVNAGGVAQAMIKKGSKPEQVIDELYLRCMGREPTTSETSRLMEFFTEERPPVEVLNDLFWSLLNSKEFIFNH